MKTLNSILMPILATEDKSSTNYMIAKYIMNHVDELSETSTASLAEACNVSKASISRFCKYVGLDDFYTLKYLIRTYVVDKYDPHLSKTTNIFDDFRGSLAVLEKKMQNHPLKEMIADMAHSSNVILMGTPQTFGSIITLQHHLSTLGKIVTVSVQPHEQVSYLLSGHKEDVIVIFAESNESLRQIFSKQSRMMRENKPKIYLLTLESHEHYPSIYKTLELGYHSPFVFSTYVEIIYETYKQFKNTYVLSNESVILDFQAMN